MHAMVSFRIGLTQNLAYRTRRNTLGSGIVCKLLVYRWAIRRRRTASPVPSKSQVAGSGTVPETPSGDEDRKTLRLGRVPVWNND